MGWVGCWIMLSKIIRLFVVVYDEFRFIDIYILIFVYIGVGYCYKGFVVEWIEYEFGWIYLIKVKFMYTL